MTQHRSKKHPVQLDSGDSGCPDCKTCLVSGLVPYFEDGSFLGMFDGLVCPMCHFGIFSKKGRNNLDAAVRQFGLVKKSALINADAETAFENNYKVQTSRNIFVNLSRHDEAEFQSESATHAQYDTEPAIKPSYRI